MTSPTTDRPPVVAPVALRPLPAPAPAGPARPAASPHLLYVDQLRVLAVIGVFVIHVCEVFNPWDEWHIVNAERSRLLGEIVVLMAPWVMPLFMLLAGVSARFSLRLRSNATYVRERVTRVLVPFVIGTLALVPIQVWLERLLRGQFHGSLWAFYPHFFDGIYPRGNLSWHHLWFLAHLFVYSILALPLFRYWQRDRGRARLRRLARFCRGPGGLLWLALPLVLERHLLWGIFLERHMLTSDWSNHALLFVAYVYGYVLADQEWLTDEIDAQWRWALWGALGSTAVLVGGTWYGLLPWRLPEPYSPGYLIFWSLYAVGAWSWMVAMIGLGRRWLSRERRLLRPGRSAGYAWYLLHQPLIVVFAFFIVRMDATPLTKALALFLLSAAGTLLGAEALRRLPVVRGLLGLRASDARHA